MAAYRVLGPEQRAGGHSTGVNNSFEALSMLHIAALALASGAPGQQQDILSPKVAATQHLLQQQGQGQGVDPHFLLASVGRGFAPGGGGGGPQVMNSATDRDLEGLRRMLLLQEQQLAIQQFRQHSRIHKEEPGLLPFRLRHN